MYTLEVLAKFVRLLLSWAQWRVPVTVATCRAEVCGWFEVGTPGGCCSMLSGRPH